MIKKQALPAGYAFREGVIFYCAIMRYSSIRPKNQTVSDS